MRLTRATSHVRDALRGSVDGPMHWIYPSTPCCRATLRFAEKENAPHALHSCSSFQQAKTRS